MYLRHEEEDFVATKEKENNNDDENPHENNLIIKFASNIDIEWITSINIIIVLRKNKIEKDIEQFELDNDICFIYLHRIILNEKGDIKKQKKYHIMDIAEHGFPL